MNIKAICEDCKKEFQVDDTDLIQSNVQAMDTGEKLYLISYKCPYCDRVHIVQVDNDETKEKLNRCTRLMAKVTRQKTNKGRADNSTVVLFNRARAQLNEMRMNLMKEYNGSLVVNSETEEAFNISFSL